MSERFPVWVLGYADDWSVRPGDTVTFHVSGAGTPTVQTQLVRLVHGDCQPGGPGFREVEIPSDVDGEHPLVEQPTHHGSYGRIPAGSGVLPAPGAALSLVAMVRPAPGEGEQPLLSVWDRATDTGVALVLTDLRPALRLGDAGRTTSAEAPEPLAANVWYLVCGTWDAARGEIAVQAVPVVNSYNSRFGPTTPFPSTGAQAAGTAPAAWPATDLLLGALDASDGRVVRGTLNGRLALPCVYGRALGEADVAALARSGATPAVDDGLVACWDLTAGIGGFDLVGAAAASPNGRLVNAPTRGVTAHNWDGSCYEWRHAPELYGAVHFHDDDVDDAGWAPTCRLTLADDLPSGVYALRLRAGDSEDHVPFFVRARPGRERDVVLVLPTASYLAYANEHDATKDVVQALAGHTPAMQPMDMLLMEHPELGLSMYDLHSDGSGVSLSSRRRPIVGMRPRHRFSLLGTWQFPSDLYLVDWLEQRGHGFDVLTDEDLHREGLVALAPYRVVVTGTHPEYTSERMLDAYEGYVAGGGNVMYMGGNGFYWVVSFHPEHPWLMEVRRGQNGVRAWEGEPGEAAHSTTGERGGLWRDRGRPPQKLFGTGFTSEGYGGSFPYERMPDGERAEVAWVFAGVDPDGPIGDFGLVGGGASGQEIDRADVTLGTPPQTYLLASAQDHNDSYKIVPEDTGSIMDGAGGAEHPNVRADMLIYQAPGGGAVFATSSIAWAGALSHNGYDNSVSRVTGNVLDRFRRGAPVTDGAVPDGAVVEPRLLDHDRDASARAGGIG